ncbi:hypothetical protein [Leptolyngbya ohadii]|uniref:hypothetical protein n=1 Tax=Leptolyngbya ohadii TaxID=1962290 RepID=UPI000B59D4BB|nr:hypothetical protein [Leptolyngbya ohadii]
MQEFRDRYLAGDGAPVTEELHQLTIDELVAVLREVGISHSRSHGRPRAIQKAAVYTVNGRKR